MGRTRSLPSMTIRSAPNSAPSTEACAVRISGRLVSASFIQSSISPERRDSMLEKSSFVSAALAAREAIKPDLETHGMAMT